MTLAGLSIDVDSVASHLEGYGFERPPETGVAYTRALPRFLDLLDTHSARATFFLIGSEARSYRDIVREVVRRGHEVASHSMTHPVPFTGLRPVRLASEVTDSRTTLEEVTDAEVVGFRAPSFGIDDRVLASLAQAGYAYDASSYPSPLLPMMRRAIRTRAAEGANKTPQDSGWREVFRSTRIHRRDTVRGPIVEVPVTTLPFVRLPYYHTPSFLLPDALNRLVGAWARARRRNVSYTFHAVDFMCVRADDLDERISRHPGMAIGLERKLELADQALRALTGRGSVVPLRELVTAEYEAR